MRRWGWCFEWKLADVWVGAFWKRSGNRLDVWVCFLPCVPLHIWRVGERTDAQAQLDFGLDESVLVLTNRSDDQTTPEQQSANCDRPLRFAAHGVTAAGSGYNADRYAAALAAADEWIAERAVFGYTNRSHTVSIKNLTARMVEAQRSSPTYSLDDDAKAICRALDLDPDWCGPVVALTPELQRLIAIGREADTVPLAYPVPLTNYDHGYYYGQVALLKRLRAAGDVPT